MVSSFRLEDKLDDATKILEVYTCLCFFKLYHLEKYECVCRESTRDIVQVVILDLVHLEEQTHAP